MHAMNGANWFWMSFMMAFSVVVLGAVVYGVVSLARRSPGEK